MICSDSSFNHVIASQCFALHAQRENNISMAHWMRLLSTKSQNPRALVQAHGHTGSLEALLDMILCFFITSFQLWVTGEQSLGVNHLCISFQCLAKCFTCSMFNKYWFKFNHLEISHKIPKVSGLYLKNDWL